MARKKAFIGAAISLGTSIVGGLMSSAAKRRQQEEQQRQQEAVYRAKEGSNMASSYNQQHANDYDLSLENERLYTSSLFKGGGSVNLKRKRNGIQENDAIKVNKPEISSKDEEKRRKEGFRRYQSKRDATLLGIKAVAQILDPTGVSSYPDIAANYVKEGGFGNNTINSLLTAVPLLGTAGKAVSVLTKGNRLRNRSGKVTGFLRDVNLYNNRKKFKPLVNDFIDNADDALKTGDLNKAKNSVKAAKNVSNRYNKIDNGAIPSIDKSQTIIRSILESEDIKNGYDAISTYRSGGSIHIKDSKKGTFTAAAKKRGQSVQGFASKVLANKDNYSPAMVKKAVFAHNAPKWKHRLGGIVNTLFRLGGGTKLKATKRATKQNLGLENANKVGVNAPTAYRRLASESSQPSRTILSSEDKVVQKALESAISISPVKGVDDTRTTYKGGGKADVNNIITEGGDAKRIGHQTFLLRGRKHRNGGIVLGKGRNAIEAEGGEVVKIDKNTMKILSTVPMANGESPANRVLKGENPNKVFDSQEQFKDRNNLNNKKYQDGGSKNISGRTTESFGTRKNNSFINSPLRIRSINNEFVNDKTKTDVKFVGGKEQKYETVPVFKKNNFNLLSDRDNNTVNRISDSLSNNYYLKNRKSIQNLNGYLRIIKDASIIGANAAIKNVPNVIEGLNDLNNNLDRNFEEPKLLDRYYENIPIDINLKENNNTNKQLENMLRYINGRPNMRLGGKSSLIRRKAALGDYLNLAGDAFNIISPLLGGSRTKRAINRMVAPTQPTQLQAVPLRTTYNIQPQLTDVYNAEQQSIAETNRNTASSVAAQARGTRLRQLGLNQRNQLRGQQQNIETQLINQNRLNRQQVTNQNIAATNDWRDRVSQFVNDQIVSKTNVDNQIIENVSAGIRDLQLRGDKNRQERNALTAIMASNPEQVNLFMKKRKEYENLLDRNSRSLLRPYRCGGSVKRKMKR